MVYAMSDIHGEYDKYIAMLDKIGFSDEDTLYVLGDVVDRGEAPVRILQDMMARDNVILLLGNHEAVARELLRQLMVEITEENCDTHVDAEMMTHLLDWQLDGGSTTMREFQKLDMDARLDVLDYLEDLPLYAVADAGERTFLLVHAGLQNFRPERSLRDYGAEELILGRFDMQRRYFEDPSVYIVCGHTPTMALTGKAEILRCGNNLCIDCGATFPGGRLACLCLDTMQYIYGD